jgi:hypothetical protein
MKILLSVIITISFLSAGQSQGIKIINPNKNTVWTSGDRAVIGWRDTVYSNGAVDILISYDSGYHFTKIYQNHIQSSPENQSVYWVVPSANSSACVIKIQTLYGTRQSFETDYFVILSKTFTPEQVEREFICPIDISQGPLKLSDVNDLFYTVSLNLQPTIYLDQNKWGVGLIGGTEYVNPKIGVTAGVLIKRELFNIKEMYLILTRLYLKVDGIYNFMNDGKILGGGLQLDSYFVTLSLMFAKDFTNDYLSLKTGLGIKIY